MKNTIVEWWAILAKTGGTPKSNRPVSTTTMTSYLIVVRAFFAWCVKERIIRMNPTSNMGRESRVRETRRQEFHNLEEREKIIALPAQGYIGLINHLGFAPASVTGRYWS
jgi:site-specific recombinase XerD